MTMLILETYKQVKQAHPDKIVLMRVGDFVEALDGDARTIAKTLDIVLVSRKFGDKRVPMAGFPYFAAEAYIKRLVEAGHKVALAENKQAE
jgi:DNA mismatch repair protein MutS